MDGVDITTTLAQDLLGENQADKKKSTEDVLRIIYYPQAIFRVKTVTRCTATMSGILINHTTNCKEHDRAYRTCPDC